MEFKGNFEFHLKNDAKWNYRIFTTTRMFKVIGSNSKSSIYTNIGRLKSRTPFRCEFYSNVLKCVTSPFKVFCKFWENFAKICLFKDQYENYFVNISRPSQARNNYILQFKIVTSNNRTTQYLFKFNWFTSISIPNYKICYKFMVFHLKFLSPKLLSTSVV